MRHRGTVSFLLLAAVASFGQAPPATGPAHATAARFAARALPVLPVEEPYDFLKPLYEGKEPVHRDPSARPAASEMAIADEGWKLAIPRRAGEPLRHAADTFATYLKTAMRVRIAVEARDSLDGWKGERRALLAAARADLPGCGEKLRGPKDYQLIVSPERIAVCGFDEAGARFGLYNLIARMNLREAPFLPRHLDTVRHSLHRTRMVLPSLGWEDWPEAQLSMLSRFGFDAIYASVYANPNGVLPESLASVRLSPWPWFMTDVRPQVPQRMHDLIRRARRHGIGVYSQLMFPITGDAANEERLRALIRDLVAQFPDMRGYILLTEGFFPVNWPPGWWRDRAQMRKWSAAWTRAVRVATEEFHKLNPSIEVLPWDYSVDFKPDAVELKESVIDQYPLDAIPLLTFENGKSYERDGERGHVQDYALNETGPAEVTAAQMVRARSRGIKTIYAKVDTFATWQYGTFPYLPFPYQWYARYQAIEKSDLAGTVENWTYGVIPNWVAEMRAWCCWTDAPPLDELLRAIARREFGPGSEAAVLEAWKHFSEAIRLAPDTRTGAMGTNNSIGSPFFFEKGRPRAMTLERSWTDQERWSRISLINPYWPYAPRRVILNPDFTNRINVAERYAQPFSLAVFNKYLLLAADAMERGLREYRRAALAAPPAKRSGAFREVMLAEQIQRMMRSGQAILEFEDLRFRLAKSGDKPERRKMLVRMSAMLREEIARTQASLEAARRDSRFGYEWEQDYFYTPDVLAEKLKQLRRALEIEIPEYRKRNGI
jgi:hypothetical protein